MSAALEISEVLRRILLHPSGGVVGLVDDLLAVCREHGLQLEWQAGRWRLSSPGGDYQEWIDVPLRKSVLRAVLARLAVLCNERNPNSVSPYGGQGELVVGGNPPTVFRVSFANTLAEQKLELLPQTEPAARLPRTESARMATDPEAKPAP
jgi:hypothetical protein